MSAEKRLKELGITLPPLPGRAGNYEHYVLSGNLLFLAGKGPLPRADGTRIAGKVGGEVSFEEAYEAARTTGISLLSAMKEALGDLDRVARVVKVFGMVNAVPTFGDTPKVINGCSDLFIAVFGEKGRHARSAVGMGTLPMSIPVEIEAVVEVKPAAPKRKAKSAGAKRKKAARRARR